MRHETCPGIHPIVIFLIKNVSLGATIANKRALMPLVIVILGIIFLFFLIVRLKLNAFIAFILVSLMVGKVCPWRQS